MKSFHLSVVSRRKYPHEFNALKFAETYDRGLNKGALYSAAVLVFVDVVYTPNPYSNPHICPVSSETRVCTDGIADMWPSLPGRLGGLGSSQGFPRMYKVETP